MNQPLLTGFKTGIEKQAQVGLVAGIGKWLANAGKYTKRMAQAVPEGWGAVEKIVGEHAPFMARTGDALKDYHFFNAKPRGNMFNTQLAESVDNAHHFVTNPLGFIRNQIATNTYKQVPLVNNPNVVGDTLKGKWLASDRKILSTDATGKFGLVKKRLPVRMVSQTFNSVPGQFGISFAANSLNPNMSTGDNLIDSAKQTAKYTISPLWGNLSMAKDFLM